MKKYTVRHDTHLVTDPEELKGSFIPVLSSLPVACHLSKEVPSGRVTVGMASLYVEFPQGVHAQ